MFICLDLDGRWLSKSQRPIGLSQAKIKTPPNRLGNMARLRMMTIMTVSNAMVRTAKQRKRNEHRQPGVESGCSVRRGQGWLNEDDLDPTAIGDFPPAR